MSNSIKFCRPLILENTSSIVAKIKETDSKYEYIEVWIDYISDLDKENFLRILEANDRELIIVTRRQNLEEPKLAKEKRFEILEISMQKGLIIDCDLRQKGELQLLKSKNYEKILLSFHNYSETPDDLEAIYKQMLEYNPLIYKFACFCTSLDDSLNLLKFGLMLKSSGNKCIVTGMGENGKIVRLASAAWFNEFNFAPISDTENTAAGQLTIEQLSKAINILKMEI